MKFYNILFLLACVVVCVSCAPRRIKVPRDRYWKVKYASLHNDQMVAFTLGLTQRNLDQLESTFWAVSDPSNAAYGQYKKLGEVNAMVRPSQAHVDAVTEWLRANQVEVVSASSSHEYIRVRASVRRIRQLFATEATIYQHKITKKHFVSLEHAYKIPDAISEGLSYLSLFNPMEHSEALMNSELVEVDADIRKRQRDTESSSSSSASNAPVITSLVSLDGGFQLRRVFIYCVDGSYPTITNTNVLSCGDAKLEAIDAHVTNGLNGEVFQNYNLEITRCILCSEDSMCSLNSYDQSAVLCITNKVFGTPNYLPWTLTVATNWSDSSVSDSTTSWTIQSVEPTDPRTIFRTYDISDNTRATHPNNVQGVVELSESFLMSDVQKYFSYVGLPDYTPLIEVINPENITLSGPGHGEGVLDLNLIMGVAQGAKTFYWASENSNNLTFIYEVVDSENPPLVLSVSWGGPETVPFTSDDGFVTRMDIEFMKAGVRGISVIVASGDFGAREFYPNITFPDYAPDYPASSPYVTSVGGTIFQAKHDHRSCFTSNWTYICDVVEAAASGANGAIIASGGGFSNLFNRPSYQDSVVSKYVRKLSDEQIAAGVNVSGRAYPDVAALSHQIPTFLDGTFQTFDGTSASAPIFGGMVTLLNDIRLHHGNTPLGFLNPFLYSLHSSHFNDVKEGDSYCVPDECVDSGFSTAHGWDPVTGLGTPLFSRLAEAVRKLPSCPSSPPPTHQPTHKPTHKPTHSPTHKPTHIPTYSPTPTRTPSRSPTYSPTSYATPRPY